MTLSDYLTSHGIREADFAARIGATQSSVNRMKRGQIPGRDLMAAIYEATGGAVTANDFYAIPDRAA